MNQKLLACSTVVFLCFCGCAKQPADRTAANLDFSDASINEFHNLGWLGAASHPLQKPLSFADPADAEKKVSPGGLVVREIVEESPAETGGLQVGDVIVGVGSDWLPINDDPTLDFIRLLETRVAAGESPLELRVVRNGESQTIPLDHQLQSLDAGVPFEIPRFVNAAARGLKRLAGLQNEDGSFGMQENSADSKLQITSLAGLALLASADTRFQQHVEKSLEYIGSQLDSRIEAAQPQATNTTEPPVAAKGTVVMKMPAIEMDPLTASYVLAFLAESNVGMMDRQWMPRQFAVFGSLNSSQHESGGWGVAPTDDAAAIDVAGTHTTNQVLLAIGMLERKGMMMAGSTDLLPPACAYLKSQMSARWAGDLNRRLKSALNAGTAAAWIANNCQRTDPELTRMVENALADVAGAHLSPSLRLPGVLSIALLARQTGKQNWLKYHAGSKYWIASLLRADGSFQSIPVSTHEEQALEPHAQDAAWQAAHYCLVLSMQAAKLEKLTAQAEPPNLVARNSDGKQASDEAKNQMNLPGGVPSGARVINLDLGDLEGGDMQEAIRKKLKERGIDIGDAKIEGASNVKKKKDD